MNPRPAGRQDGTGLTGDTERAEAAEKQLGVFEDLGEATWRDELYAHTLRVFARTDRAQLLAALHQTEATCQAWRNDITGRGELNPPYIGWIGHYAGWQTVLVYKNHGLFRAHRLGDEVSLERAQDMCQVLHEQAGLPIAGEISKQGFTPVTGDNDG
jgi:hypothetical protein